jgi:hypothetical protein
MKVEELVDEYIRLRDQKSAIAAKAKEITDKLEAKMADLQQEIVGKFGELGVESARTKAGTAFLKTSRSTSVAQWDDFLPWVQTTGNWHMLTRAANKTAVLEYADAHEDLPPGINLYSKIELGINRPTKTKKAA